MMFLKIRPYTTPFLFVAFIFFCRPLLKAAPSSCSTDPILHSDEVNKSGGLTGNIQIRNRQLLINGKPFIMKGVCYSPTRKGASYPSGLIFLNPSDEDLALIEKDFQMMHAAGVNTLRTYVPMLDQRVLDLLVKYEFKTIVPSLNTFDTPIEDIINTVSILKNHPSTLIWELGNEWNYNYFYSKIPSSLGNDKPLPDEIANGIGLIESVNLIKHAIDTIRVIDTIHPISTVIGDLPNDNNFWLSLPDERINLYASNIYGGLTFCHPSNNRFERWKSISNKPLYISEFGTDAFNSILNHEDPDSQAIGTRALLTEIQNNLSANDPNNILVGGSIFEWNDEWWKDGNGSPDVHDSGGIVPADIENGPYPDNVFNEEWWGIVDIDRNPRPAYDVLKEFYSK